MYKLKIEYEIDDELIDNYNIHNPDAKVEYGNMDAEDVINVAKWSVQDNIDELLDLADVMKLTWEYL